MSLTLHPTHGVNPHMTQCMRCGGDANELVLIGNRTSIYKCTQCDLNLIGHRSSEPCPKCHTSHSFEFVRNIEEHDKLPASEPCAKCKEEIATHKAVVEAGGVYWKCDECKREGVIKADAPFSAAVRKAHNIDAPAPCGVQFSKCVEHTPGGGE